MTTAQADHLRRPEPLNISADMIRVRLTRGKSDAQALAQPLFRR